MRHVEVCDIGKVRDINQDAVMASSMDGYGIFAVADGMGGHSHGELASRHIIKILGKWWENFDPAHVDNGFQEMVGEIRAALEQANNDIYCKYNRDDVCGSTAAVLFVSPDAYAIFNVGDSRIYMQHGDLFTQMTLDETWENQGNLGEREKMEDRDECRGQLVNAVGVYGTLRCTVCTDTLKRGMVFLLCSDGLYKFCPETSLKKYMKKAAEQEPLERCGKSLLELAYQTKASDNISFVFVRI